MIQGVVDTMHIDEAAAEKDWWVTAVLYALLHTKAGDYLLFKGGTSLSKVGISYIVSMRILIWHLDASSF